MKCPEITPLVPRFFDGELDGPLMRKIALHITRCSDCESELRGLEKLQDLIAGHFRVEVDGIDTSSVWTAVSARLEEKPRSRRHRLKSWWDDLEIVSPLTVWPALAAAASVFLVISLWTGDAVDSKAGLARIDEIEVDDRVASVRNAVQFADNSAVFESIIGGVDTLMVEPKTQTAVIWINDSGDFR